MRARILASLLTALGMAAATAVSAAPAQAAPTCYVSYRLVGSWPAAGTNPAGFHGEFILTTDPGVKTKGWRVEVHFRAGVELNSNWNSVVVLDAAPVYVFGNASWNFEIQPGGTTKFEMFGKKTANNISNHPYSAVCAPLF
jgi:hypothetical protein